MSAAVVPPRPLDATVLAREVTGVGLADAATLGEVCAGSLTLLVFLRHHG
jgi:hypothetical protein